MFRQASNHCKRVIESAKNRYVEKKKESIVSQKVGSCDFWRIANSVLNRGKSAIPPLFTGPEVLTSASAKAKLFAELFSKISNLNESGHELPSFNSRTAITLTDMVITPKMIKKAISNLSSSKASGPDAIAVVVLKNCEPEFSFILTDWFNLCLKESCFPDCWKVSFFVPVFKNVGGRSDPKNYHPVSLLSVVSKIFEKFINDKLVRHLESVGLFCDFQYGFRSSRSTADLLTVVTERIARTLNLLGATRAIALDISKAFDRVWHNGLLHKLNAYGVTDGIFQIISSFLSGPRLKVVLDGKSFPEFAINAGVPIESSILGPTLFLLFINDLPDMVLSKVAIYADGTTLYCSCDKACDMWKQLEMSSGLESDLRDTV